MTLRSFLSPRRVSRGRQGLTLMELVVVMAILIALAALLVPLFPNMIERAHKASESTNQQELTKLVSLYQATYGSYPDGYDMLTDGTNLIDFFPSAGAASPAFYGETFTPGTANYIGFTYPMGGYLAPGALDGPHAQALVTAGIVNLYPLAGAGSAKGNPPTNSTYTGGMGWSPTFNPYASDTPTATNLTGLAGGTSTGAGPTVVFLQPSAVQRANMSTPKVINGASTTQFVLFGVGRFCSLVGTNMYSPPHLYPDDTVHENPTFVYERFGVVFQLEDASGNVLPAAVFIGAVSIESDGMESSDKTLESYYQRVPQPGSAGGSP